MRDAVRRSFRSKVRLLGYAARWRRDEWPKRARRCGPRIANSRKLADHAFPLERQIIDPFCLSFRLPVRLVLDSGQARLSSQRSPESQRPIRTPRATLVFWCSLISDILDRYIMNFTHRQQGARRIRRVSYLSLIEIFLVCCCASGDFGNVTFKMPSSNLASIFS
jgi:hypothetical protein